MPLDLFQGNQAIDLFKDEPMDLFAEEEHWAISGARGTGEEIGRQIVAIPETVATLATGMAAFTVGGWVGIKELVKTGRLDEATKAIEAYQQKYTYQPRQVEAREAVGLVLKPIEWMQEARDYWGTEIYNITGSADLAAGAATALEMGFYSLPGMKSKVRLTKLKPWERGITPETFIREQRRQLTQNLEESRKVPKDALKVLKQKELKLAALERVGEIKAKEMQAFERPIPELKIKIIERKIPDISKKIKPSEVRKPYEKPFGRPPIGEVALGKVAPKEVTLETFGTQHLYEKITSEIPKMKELSKRALDKAVDIIDVEARFKRYNAPETGYHAKAYFSQSAMHEEFGIEIGKKLLKLIDYNKKDLQQIPLLYENPSQFAKLPKAEQARLKPAIDYFGKYFEDSLKEYKAKGGLHKGFKERIVAEIEEMLTKDISPKDRLSLEQALKDAKQMNFVHIPSALWFESYLGTNPTGARSVLRLLVKQHRKNLRIQDLIDRKIIKPEQVNAVDIIGNYARRKGKDMAILNLKNAALKEGLASLTEKEGYVKLPAYRAPALADVYIHPVLADYVGYELLGRGLDLGKVGKWLSLSKMAAFINPGILPMYDIVQHAMLTGLHKWSISKPMGNIPFYHLSRGARNYLKKTPDYWEALDNGLASKPYNNPFETYQNIINWTKKNKGEKFLAALETVFPQKTIKNLYNTSWHIAWELDKMIRMGTYDLLKSKGFSPREAAQIAAKAHSDYASVPAHIRRMLNIPFFTPTFKITMGKFYGQMIKDAAVYSGKLGGLLGKVSPKTKVFGKALAATFVINQAFELFMKQLGFERDEWGRRYVRRIETEEEGARELVVTWSAPSNMFLKYIYRAKMAADPAVDKGLLRFFEMNKWEIQPVWRVGYEIITNDNGLGEHVYNPFDKTNIKVAKSMKYAITHVIRLLGLLDRDKADKEGRERFAKETSKLLELVTHPFTFKYTRNIEERRQMWKLKAVEKRFKILLRKGEIEPQHFKVFIDNINEILKEGKAD